MTAWSPEWKLTIDGTEYTELVLSNLNIGMGRTDIYQQPVAGYANVSILNIDHLPVTIAINDSMTIQLKNSAGVFVPIFGGFVTDYSNEITSSGTVDYIQTINVTALGALSRLPKSITTGVLSSDYDGNQMQALLQTLLFQSWNATPAALQWNTFNATETWANALNIGYGEIDTPGDYLLDQRDSESSDYYSIASRIANSGLGYIYEDAQGRVSYADSTHRSEYLATNGYVDLSGADALAAGIKTVTRSGDIRNQITINYKKDQSSHYSTKDQSSITLYGEQGQVIDTTLKGNADAISQADFYLSLRAYPRAVFDSITYQLANSNITDSDRDSLIGTFIGMPVNIEDLPMNISGGRFQGFVEGWNIRASYNALEISLTVSPIAFSLQAFRWQSVPATEHWTTLIPTLDWLNATIVA